LQQPVRARTHFAFDKAVEWSFREQEFVKRAGFVLMATLAVHQKKTPDEAFLQFLSAYSKRSKRRA
jgi:3-methyladenine DNA glycosylase AlkD